MSIYTLRQLERPWDTSIDIQILYNALFLWLGMCVLRCFNSKWVQYFSYVFDGTMKRVGVESTIERRCFLMINVSFHSREVGTSIDRSFKRKEASLNAASNIEPRRSVGLPIAFRQSRRLSPGLIRHPSAPLLR